YREHLVSRPFARQRAFHGAGRNTRGDVARHRDPAVVPFDLVAVDHQLDAPVVPAVTGLHEAVDGARVHDIALRVVGTHDVAVGVIEDAGVAQAHAGQQVDVVGEFAREAVGHPVLGAFGWVFALHAAVEPQALREDVRRTFRDQVDAAARSAQAMNGIRAVQHFHTLEHGGVDGVTVAAAVTQRIGLRHAVDHVQR